MENYYKSVERLANQAGGHYHLSVALVRRVRQLVKGLSSFRSEPVDPILTSFDEYVQGKLQILGKTEEVEEGKKSAKGRSL